MKRPIKFRIYDLINKKFLSSGTEPWTEVLDLGAWQDETRFVISQYTGVKDKNGNDIWEGDVVKIEWDDGMNPIRDGYVKWHYRGFCIFDLNSQEWPTVWAGDFDHAMVVGNVWKDWQKPELMK